MDIAKKTDYAKLHIDNIAAHDDAPIEEVSAALSELADYAQYALAQAQAKRAEREAAATAAAEAAAQAVEQAPEQAAEQAQG